MSQQHGREFFPGRPWECLLVNILDERDRAEVRLGFTPSRGMHMNVPWSGTRHLIEYVYWDDATGAFRLGMLPIDGNG